MPKTRDIVAEIKALMPPAKGTRWFERVNADQAAVIQEISDAWTAGLLGDTARTVSKAIATRLAAAGVHISHNTVREWLRDIKRS